MRILFLTGEIYGLSSLLLNEMKRQGHDISIIEDKVLPYESGFNNTPLFRRIKNRFHNQEEIKKKYWNSYFNSNLHILEKKHDICLCINGYSLAPLFFEEMKKRNPGMKFILYLWDSLNFFDFKRNFQYFDKIYSFDYEDSNANSSVNFLPFYWIPPTSPCGENKYYMTSVGSNHCNRLYITEKIAKQLDEWGLSYKFNIVDSCNGRLSLKTLFKLFFAYLSNDYATAKEIKTHLGYIDTPLLTKRAISIEKTINLIANSECVLDTDNEIQAGPTPRFMWAMALGKKVITTNRHVINMPFYDKRTIFIIDRKKPYLNYDFLSQQTNDTDVSSFEKYRIDNWVKYILG
ncbi:MAG: hypothetical protein IKQ47_02135 [Prevotella sp.]|nr:hypothetical protein [Prevotella sp.]